MRPLYLEDSYLKEFESIVKEVNNEKYIVLENTAFYPTSGGQPHDEGQIICNNTTYNVVYVGKFSGNISHEVDKPGLNPGDKIKGIINWERRYRLMRMHTASHIIASIFHREANLKITGNQLGLDKSRMDFNMEDFDKDKIQHYLDLANKAISENHEVTIKFVSRAEALKAPELFKLAKEFPQDIKEIRIVTIGNIDRQADGGTHVNNTKEIGQIQLLKLENKGKNNRRLYFTLNP
jgi:misacylated tRNA(Ala) deacylase